MSIHLSRLVILAVVVTGGLMAIAVLPRWLIVLTPRWLVRRASIAFLWTLLALYPAALLVVLIGGTRLFRVAVRGHRPRDRALLEQGLRWALLASSCLFGMIALEAGSAIKLRSMLRLPALPTRFSRPAHPAATSVDPAATERRTGQEPGGSSSTSADGLYIVVVGESSARGEPYHPWLSVGQLVGWQLEQVFPGREVQVEVRADGGLCLEQAVLRLRNLDRRPDAMIVFAGHNEFQARFGWSRNVSHYIDDGATSPVAILDRARAISWACKLILATLDVWYGETPPSPRSTRELVDNPVCSPKEYAFLREDFQVRLDALTGYCAEIRCLPVLIMPASNDGSFDPNRSVLAESMPADLRAAFAREFEAARAAESVDSAASIIAYRRLVEEHPEFAEVHYRLGRLLAASGAWNAANRHFVLARDLDGLPLRCPTDFREAYRITARRHGAVLIDGHEVLSRVSPHGVLDDHLFHDAHHVNLVGTVALANDILVQLAQRRAFGWPGSTPAPRIEPEACARHFGLDAQKWATVCERSRDFYERTAFVRSDPAPRLRVTEQYRQATLDFAAGRPLRDTSHGSIAMADSLLKASRMLPTVAAPPRSAGR